MTGTRHPDLLEVIAAFFAAGREADAGQVHPTPEPEPELDAGI
jgi:hypothetical protein